MKNKTFLYSIAICSLLVASIGCASTVGKESAGDANVKNDNASNMAAIKELVAVIHPTEGNEAHGAVHFSEVADGVKVVADIEGLTPNQKHGFHIHEYGDCEAANGTSAGGHYNPEGYDHGLPTTVLRHAGDLGNLQADENGAAHYEITVHNISIGGMHNPILGRGVIVHAKPDDGGQPTGNAGARLGCGVIGVANGSR